MNLSAPFIARPVATCLLMAAIFLSGVLGYGLLPQAPLPQVDYPTIVVMTKYPGASPQVMANTVTAPLERQFGAMSGLSQMSSSSSFGVSTINLRFNLDVRLDVAEQTVQSAINAATNLLPRDLPSPPTYNKVNPADAPILTLAVASKSLPLTQIQDLVDTRLVQKLSQVPGVGLVSLRGGQKPAVRVALNPTALAAHGIGVERVKAAIASANSSQPTGNFDGPELAYTIETNGQLERAEDFGAVVVATKQGTPVRLRDIAHVTEGPEDAYLAAWANGAPAILVDVQRQPNANVIEIVDAIRQLLPTLEAALPLAVSVDVISDRTTTIRSSIADVQKELLLAVGLVVVVIFVFLRTLSATAIPSLAVPLSLVGSFGVMYALDFSVNNLTLMALAIGTGFVVDDAIVMIENVARHIEAGKNPLRAAYEGASEIGFTIVSLTCSLIAVLIPLLFMADVVGRLFREFAVTLVVAIVVSAVVSLTFTPMLCARLLKPHVEPGWFHRSTERGLSWLVEGYSAALRFVLAWRRTALLATAFTVLATLALAYGIPKGFFPTQDTGLLQAHCRAPAGVSFAKMSALQAAAARRIAEHPAVENVASIVGIDGVNPSLNRGRLLIKLKPDKHRRTAHEVALQLQSEHALFDDLHVAFLPVQDLTIDDRITQGEFQYLVESPDETLVRDYVPQLLERMRTIPTLTDVTSNLENDGLDILLQVDRDRAGRLGVAMSTIDELLYSAFGQRFVSTIFTQTSQYRVLLETLRHEPKPLEVLDRLYVTSADDHQVRLSSLVTLHERTVPLVVHREKQSPAATISFNLARGTSLSDAVPQIEQARAALELPQGITARFQGAALAFEAALRNELLLLLASIVTMYIVLGVLYESFVHPLTILSTLPSAGIGALVALWATGYELNVIAIIGIVLLIGIVQKNAIMIIDFALSRERDHGVPALDAVVLACRLRFRPILMTTLAALFSAVPMVLGTGPGSELRKPLGIAMIGGLLVSQVLTLFTTPVIYLALDGLRSRKQHTRETEPRLSTPNVETCEVVS